MTRARVRVEGELVGRIERGMLVLVCVLRGDGEDQALRLARRLASLRLFPDERGRMNLCVTECGGAALVVSQVTLAWDPRGGRRPSLDDAAQPARARELYRLLVAELRSLGVSAETGRFGAWMEVELASDGPVTLYIEEAPLQGRASRGG